ncbi:MAG: squalene/phytoene synthase family protein, partial [Burkholderiales bacterium]
MTPDEYCRNQAAPSGSSFYYSILFLPADKRRALTALFAFYREIEESAKECSDPALGQIKLNWWRQELATAFGGRAQHPVTQALLPAATQFALPQELLLQLIDGMES